jgi:hypothetical protein
MGVSQKDISICSSALLQIGADEINSFSDETREAKVAKELYPIILESLISEHPWKFSKKQVLLSRLDETPLYGFDYAYQLPSDNLNMIGLELLTRYEIQGNKLYCNDSAVKCVYQYKPDESTYPAYFVLVLMLELSSAFAMSLFEDRTKSEYYAALALDKKRMAKRRDSQSQTTGAIRPENFSLLTVRR